MPRTDVLGMIRPVGRRNPSGDRTLVIQLPSTSSNILLISQTMAQRSRGYFEDTSDGLTLNLGPGGPNSTPVPRVTWGLDLPAKCPRAFQTFPLSGQVSIRVSRRRHFLAVDPIFLSQITHQSVIEEAARLGDGEVRDYGSGSSLRTCGFRIVNEVPLISVKCSEANVSH